MTRVFQTGCPAACPAGSPRQPRSPALVLLWAPRAAPNDDLKGSSRSETERLLGGSGKSPKSLPPPNHWHHHHHHVRNHLHDYVKSKRSRLPAYWETDRGKDQNCGDRALNSLPRMGLGSVWGYWAPTNGSNLNLLSLRLTHFTPVKLHLWLPAIKPPWLSTSVPLLVFAYNTLFPSQGLPSTPLLDFQKALPESFLELWSLSVLDAYMHVYILAYVVFFSSTRSWTPQGRFLLHSSLYPRHPSHQAYALNRVGVRSMSVERTWN